MSVHAEAQSHEHKATNESAFETFFEGIGKIISSVRIAVTKVFRGIADLFRPVFESFSDKKNSAAHSHANHSASPPPAVKPEQAAATPPAADKSHGAEKKNTAHH
jgi:hypothetical protein